MQHDIDYGDFKHLAKRKASDKVLRDNAFNKGKNTKYHGHQRGISSMVYDIFEKMSVLLADTFVESSGPK